MADLGPAGQELFDSLTAAIRRHPEATRALALEAARAVDRLNDLDDIIDGKDVLGLLRFRLADDAGNVAEVKFDGVLSEARQQQASLAGLMKAITPNLDESASVGEKKGDAVDQIAARRAARGAGPAAGAARASEHPA